METAYSVLHFYTYLGLRGEASESTMPGRRQDAKTSALSRFQSATSRLRPDHFNLELAEF